MHPQPFHLFTAEIANAMVAARAWPGEDWWLTQMPRLELFHDTGESAKSAAETMIAFGKGELKRRMMAEETSPLRHAIRVVRH